MILFNECNANMFYTMMEVSSSRGRLRFTRERFVEYFNMFDVFWNLGEYSKSINVNGQTYPLDEFKIPNAFKDFIGPKSVRVRNDMCMPDLMARDNTEATLTPFEFTNISTMILKEFKQSNDKLMSIEREDLIFDNILDRFFECEGLVHSIDKFPIKLSYGAGLVGPSYFMVDTGDMLNHVYRVVINNLEK